MKSNGHFHPLDGLSEADTLFLLENPCPRTPATGKRMSSRFVSRH